MDVTLEFLARQQEKILTEMAIAREDALVSTSILMRMDGTLSGLVNEIRATHAQISRLNNRIKVLEDHADQSG